MADPRSLSVKELTAATQKAVARITEQQKGRFKPPYILGYFPPHLCGFIIRNVDADLTHGEARRIAADAFKEIAGQVAGVDQFKPAVLIKDDLTTMGFFPTNDVFFKE